MTGTIPTIPREQVPLATTQTQHDPSKSPGAVVVTGSETIKGGFMSWVFRFFTTKDLLHFFQTSMWHYLAFPLVWAFETVAIILEGIALYLDPNKDAWKITRFAVNLLKYALITAAVIIAVPLILAGIFVAAAVVGALFTAAMAVKSVYHTVMTGVNLYRYFTEPKPTSKLAAYRKHQILADAVEDGFLSIVCAGVAVIAAFVMISGKGLAAFAGVGATAALVGAGALIFGGRRKAAKIETNLRLDEEVAKVERDETAKSRTPLTLDRRAEITNSPVSERLGLGANLGDTAKPAPKATPEWAGIADTAFTTYNDRAPLLAREYSDRENIASAAPLPPPANTQTESYIFATILLKARAANDKALWDATKERIVNSILDQKKTFLEQQQLARQYEDTLKMHFYTHNGKNGSRFFQLFKNSETASWKKVENLTISTSPAPSHNASAAPRVLA